MGSIGSSSSFSSCVSLHVLNRQIFEIFSIGIGFKVLDKAENNLHRFLRPSAHSFAEFGGLSSSADSPIMFGVWDAPSVGENIIEVFFGFGDGHTFDSFGSFVGVFIMSSDIFSGGSGD